MRGDPRAVDVTVIIPTQSRCARLAETLRSVLNQRDVALTVIVVDEASTDGTPAYLGTLDDGRVRVIRHERPLGVSAARNRGAAEAQSEWLAFVDDDDLWAPDKLASQLRAATAIGSDWVYTGAVSITDDGRVVRGRAPLPPDEAVEALPRYNAIPGGGSNVAVRRAMWLRTHGFNVALRAVEDWELWIRLAKLGPPAWVCRPQVARRLHSSNATLNLAEVVRGTKMLQDLHRAPVDWGTVHRWMAHSCLRSGRTQAALWQFSKAAVRGQFLHVVSDLDGWLRERLGRPAAPGAAPGQSNDVWVATAAAWLREFQNGPKSPDETVPAASPTPRWTSL